LKQSFISFIVSWDEDRVVVGDRGEGEWQGRQGDIFFARRRNEVSVRIWDKGPEAHYFCSHQGMLSSKFNDVMMSGSSFEKEVSEWRSRVVK
jgi:hypothetical protein